MVQTVRPDAEFAWRRAAIVVLLGYVAMFTVVVAIGLLLTHALDGTVGRWDDSTNVWLAQHRTGPLNRLTEITTWFVNTLPAIGLATIVAATCALWRRWRGAALIALALSLELFVFLAVNVVVGRPRPDVVRLSSTPSTSSYPSGHTAAATVIFVGLAIIVWTSTRNFWARAMTIVAAVAFPALVGFARVYRGMHHLTDVFVGAVMGAACLVVALLAIRAPAPEASQGEREDDETTSSAFSATAG